MKPLYSILCLMVLVMSCHKTDPGNLNIEIIAPTVFLPDDANGNHNSIADCPDGSTNCNAVFKVKISNPDGVPLQCELKIIDQRGILLYADSDMSQGWNGKKNGVGELAPQGTYIYQFKATNPNTGDFKIQKGEFALLR